MDTSIRIIKKDKSDLWLGASHMGYESLTLRAVDIFIRLIKNDVVSNEDFHFVNSNFKEYKNREDECPDIIVDTSKNIVSFLNGFDFRKKEKYQKSELVTLEKVTFSDYNLFLKRELSYEEFSVLYEFIKSIEYKTKVIINDEYVYYFN